MATGSPSLPGHPAAHRETWDLDGRRGLRTENRGASPPLTPCPAAVDRWARQAVALLVLGSAGCMCPPDRHCERKIAGREQTRYLFSCNLWAGVAPRGQERVTCPTPSHTRSMLSVPFTSWWHMLLVSISLCYLPRCLFGFPCLPPCLGLSPGPCLGSASPDGNPVSS